MAPRLRTGTGQCRAAVLSGRVDTLTDADLVALLVSSGDAVVGRAVLEAHPRPDALWRVGPEELIAVPGVGPAGAARLIACLELARRASAWPVGERPVVSTPEDVCRLCATQLRGLDREHFWALVLSTKNRLLRIVEVSVGSLNTSIVHPRELFKEAVRASAASIVVVHNHPSGDPTPSSADLQLTRRLAKAGEVLGIELLDHVVIGDGGAHASMRQMGVL
jgi:DNA repair protein RadC